MRTLRWALAGMAVVAFALYVGVLLLLFTHQRDMLFVRGRTAQERNALYQARVITETDGTQVAIWQAPAVRPGR